MKTGAHTNTCDDASKLFAALFPASRFRYSIVLEYSVILEDTPYLTAVYENNELMMRDSVLYNYGDKEKIAEICKKMIEIDPEAREKYEQYLKGTASEDYEDVDWLFFWRIWLMTHVKRWLRCMITE